MRPDFRKVRFHLKFQVWRQIFNEISEQQQLKMKYSKGYQ